MLSSVAKGRGTDRTLLGRVKNEGPRVGSGRGQIQARVYTGRSKREEDRTRWCLFLKIEAVSFP